MRATLDTNVLFSGVVFGGTPGRIVSCWQESRFELALSASIIVEYRRVAAEAERDIQAEFLDLIDLMAAHSVFVEDAGHAYPLCRDPDDDKFLKCAAAANAVLVSGDKDLLAANGILGVRVVTPRAFLSLLDQPT